MTASKNQKFFFLAGLIVIYAFGITIQSHSLLKSDNLWLLYLARAVFHGKHYGTDFFEVNPPMSFLLYMPEILIEKIWSVSHVLGLQIYIFLCATLSLLMCYFLSKKLFNDTHVTIGLGFLLILAISFLILPFHEFGQREHFFVMLTMPYILLSSCRLENKAVHHTFVFFIGLLAGIGFSIKPFFFATFFLIEGYVSWKLHKQRKNWIRPEAFIVILFALLYLLVIYLFFKAYIITIIPIVTRIYYQSLTHDGAFRQIWITRETVFCLFNYFFYYATRKINPFITLSTLLILAITGDVIACIMQKTTGYHFLPALLVSAILFIFLLTVFWKFDKQWGAFKAVTIGIFVYVFALDTALSLNFALKKKREMNPLILFIHKISFHQPIYFFSANDASSVSAISYANAYFRNEFLYWFRRYDDKPYVENQSFQQKQDIQNFTTAFAEHINHDKPALIFADNTCVAINNHLSSINCLHYLMTNKLFQSAWKHYHYIMTIESRRWYNIYERDNATYSHANTAPNCQVYEHANDAFQTTAFCSHV